MKPARFMALLLAGCTLASPDREAAGDAAWHQGRWSDAMADYRAAGESPRVTAKFADAALQGGALSESAEAWTRLGGDGPDRVGEAGAGLARVADLAERGGKSAALALAIVGLRRVAPGWPVGRLAGRLGTPAVVPPDQLADLVPALLAATPDRAASDPLLVTLGQADRVRGACDNAVPLLEGVLRRTANAGLRDSAIVTLDWCELGLGLSALGADHPGDAERWFEHAAVRDPQGAVGRRALIGVGDARVRQGDSLAARAAWRAVATTSAPADSLTQMALLRLGETPPLPGNDTTVPHPVRP